MTTFIYTFGCKVNQVESEHFLNRAETAGLQISDRPEDADSIILNSCAVTERAVNKLLSLLRKIKRNNPDIKLLVTGCAAEMLTEKLKESGADIVVTNTGKKDVIQYLTENRDFLAPIESRTGLDIGYTPMKSRTRAFVKIQDGCDSFCSYCIIPSLRGKPVSKPMEQVIDEVKGLISEGYREIVPVGIHVGKYGRDRGENLLDLLERLACIAGDSRIRLTSIEVNELDERLIPLMNSGKVCPHLHVPIQSGSRSVLKRMNRHYTPEEYLEKTRRFKEQVKDLTLGGDVITGFPGETEAEAAETEELIRSAGVDFLHVFQYSDREGTPASAMPDKVHSSVKKARAANLRELGEELKNKTALSMRGRVLRVLAQNDGSGLTDNYFEAELPADCQKNTFYGIDVREVSEQSFLKGEVFPWTTER
ncbi:tRNA (N(6)-L-threonylcarbamoyladenosine(37)-C(2))-methylthiotransferase MtaB [Limisalsivibrio acetivorans]|uniref:tRNA (N(6)-L-threonylcarbamoyladenosine(37)-C(2))- methylthiotransferase MtaB n=1 Tax=Limisalsivibrio acetivorans TaxID=1304888 RepID=UPI0003B3317B|nr:tRNA (N(6)-L-threonylcarbamoyladenosine(37)-C(2))-methylthiotransferase MtaB [Limisalsivibrio acetivorans]